jgi:hypothetical protein
MALSASSAHFSLASSFSSVDRWIQPSRSLFGPKKNSRIAINYASLSVVSKIRVYAPQLDIRAHPNDTWKLAIRTSQGLHVS